MLVVAFLSFGAYWMLLAQLPVALREERFHLSAAGAGLLPLVGLLGIATAALTGSLGDRLGPRAPVVGALAAGIAGLALTLPPSGGLGMFAVGYGAFLAAYWAYMPVGAAEVVARARPGERQAALFAFYAAMWSGAAVAPLAGAALGDWSAAALAALIAWLVSAVIAATTFTRKGAA